MSPCEAPPSSSSTGIVVVIASFLPSGHESHVEASDRNGACRMPLAQPSHFPSVRLIDERAERSLVAEVDSALGHRLSAVQASQELVDILVEVARADGIQCRANQIPRPAVQTV